MSLPVKALPVVQQWDCHVSGSCCKEYRIPVTDEEVKRIEAQGWTAEELGGHSPFTTTGWFHRQTSLNSRSGEGCVFLSEQGRCRIHERFGYDAKPLPCRLFPFVLIPAGDHWRVGVRFACPSAAANKGRGAAEYSDDLHVFAGQLAANEGWKPQPDGSLNLPPYLDDGTRLDWPDTHRLVDGLLKLVLDEKTPIERRLRKCLHLATSMKSAKLKDIKAGQLSELLHLFSVEAEQVTPADPAQVPPPTWVGRILFRQAAALFTRKDQGPNRGEPLRSFLSRIAAAWRFMRGVGTIPRLHRKLPEATFEEAEVPRGPLPAEAQRVLERYYAIKVWSMQFCASSKGPPFWAGFEQLALTCPLILWVARLFRDIPRDQAVITALTIIDDHFGFNPMLNGLRQRMGLGILASRGEIARLIAWYSR
jgi:lysine-N-methylase